MREIDKVLDRGERIVWEGKPALAPYIIRRLLLSMFFLPFGGFFFFPILFGILVFDISLAFLLIPVFLICTILVLALVISFMGHSVSYYGLTNKRAVIQKGIIGRDFTLVEFRNLTHVDVNVSALEKLFAPNCGSLRLHTAGTGGRTSQPLAMESIDDPYDLFKMVSRKVRPRQREV